MPLPTWNADTEAEDASAALQGYIEGKNVLITGCTIGGLGYEAAKVISGYANLVILAGSSPERLNAASESIKSSTPHANLRALVVDLASLESVRRAAAEVERYLEPIHVLINNAAAKIGPYALTKDGFESQFGVDHLAHFLLTMLLIPKLLAAKTDAFSPRVVNVASEAHKIFDDGGIRFEDLSFQNGVAYHNYRAYAQAKTANFLFTGELARRAKHLGIKSYALQPGAIWTNSAATTSKEDYIAMGAMDKDGNLTDMFNWKTMGQGAAKYIVAGFDPRIDEESGGYIWNDCQIHNEQIAPYASDKVLAARLWTLSEKLVGQEFSLDV